MPQATCAIVLSLGGITIQRSILRSGDHPNPYEITLPAGKAGTLSTRTDNDTGVVTAADHTLVVGDKVDIYWSGGRRYGMAVSSVSGNDVTVGTGAGEVGAGDVFPAQGTAVVIAKQLQINTAIDGDKVQIFGLAMEFADANEASKGHVSFKDSGGLTIAELDLSANTPSVYDVAGGQTNPFTGNPITAAYASNGSSLNPATLKILSLEDSTP
jgi:hypothetical protein